MTVSAPLRCRQTIFRFAQSEFREPKRLEKY